MLKDKIKALINKNLIMKKEDGNNKRKGPHRAVLGRGAEQCQQYGQRHQKHTGPQDMIAFQLPELGFDHPKHVYSPLLLYRRSISRTDKTAITPKVAAV